MMTILFHYDISWHLLMAASLETIVPVFIGHLLISGDWPPTWWLAP